MLFLLVSENCSKRIPTAYTKILADVESLSYYQRVMYKHAALNSHVIPLNNVSCTNTPPWTATLSPLTTCHEQTRCPEQPRYPPQQRVMYKHAALNSHVIPLNNVSCTNTPPWTEPLSPSTTCHVQTRHPEQPHYRPQQRVMYRHAALNRHVIPLNTTRYKHTKGFGQIHAWAGATS